MSAVITNSAPSRARAGGVLVVEDDPGLLSALCDTLELAGFSAEPAPDGASALEKLDRGDYGLVVSDVQMSPMDGLALLQRIKSHRPELPVLLMTAYGTIQQAVNAMREGAADYLVKPFEAEVLAGKVSGYFGRACAPAPGAGGETMVGAAPATRSVRALADRVAASNVTVMITGESGTGKEVLARHIHRQSARSRSSFVALNCAAIPENMLEAMLFGYEKGAFTGAFKACPGKFEQADGGTLLLDEISEMAMGLQAKLLRVLQEREVERLGATNPVQLDVRVLATTNRNLAEEVAGGRFREDLYYRLNVFPIHLSPLRERTDDILPLSVHLLARACAAPPERERQPGLTFSPAAEEKLLAHRWPGNVRELDNVIQRAVVLAQGDAITAGDILFEAGGGPSLVPGAGGDTLGEELRSSEHRLICDALEACGGNRTRVAEKLGISARTLRYKLARMRQAGIVTK